MIKPIQQERFLVSLGIMIIVVLMGCGRVYAQDAKAADARTLYQQALSARLEGNIKEAHDIIEKALAENPQDAQMLQLEKGLAFFKDKDGQYPEHVQSQGGALFANLLNNSQNPVELGQGDQEDLVKLPTSQMHVKAPVGWQKQSDSKTIQYFIANSPLPKILVVLDDATGASSALEFCQAKRKQLMQNPQLTITDPKEETINGRKVAYMEFSGPTNQGFNLHMAWYQILIDQTIVTISSVNKDSEFQKGLDALREVVNSATFQ